MAKLPNSRQEPQLKDLAPGQKTWTVPWAMYAERNGKLWLNGDYSQNHAPGGTVEMLVMRDKRTGAYHVDARQTGHQWSKDGPCYCGDFTPIEVAEAKF